ncbi:hypothetical protein PSTT_05897 [Puccinia striiformis]|uniref:Uncharacterized protein n=1 Tax=Puccinia striiformis TaxID=27350 RepID=A0A2S4VMD4_9BASI|nr:hypothetical protein PSTT_05897 [Puccinia striiformis]
MSESLSDNASNISILSDDTTISTQPSSLRCSSDEGQASPISEPSELSYKEIQALKQYSHSVQNFKDEQRVTKEDTVGFHSSNLTIDNTESPPAFKPASTEQMPTTPIQTLQSSSQAKRLPSAQEA